MAALNYYYGTQRGNLQKTGVVIYGTASNGTGSDVEVRVQMNNGTVATGITKKDVLLQLETIRQFILNNGVVPSSLSEDLPPL